MIAGEMTVFRNGADEPEFDKSVLIEIVDWDKPNIELGIDYGQKRIFIKLRISDLIRELEA